MSTPQRMFYVFHLQIGVLIVNYFSKSEDSIMIDKEGDGEELTDLSVRKDGRYSWGIRLTLFYILKMIYRLLYLLI
jgi:hypothetical protein